MSAGGGVDQGHCGSWGRGGAGLQEDPENTGFRSEGTGKLHVLGPGWGSALPSLGGVWDRSQGPPARVAVCCGTISNMDLVVLGAKHTVPESPKFPQGTMGQEVCFILTR